MKTKLNVADVIQLAEFLEVGCQTGRDWTQVFLAVSEHPVHPRLKTFCSRAIDLYKFRSAAEVFSHLEMENMDVLQRMFFKIILSSFKSSGHFSVSLKSFISTARRIERLRRQLASLMFLPKFQAWLALAIVLLFIAVLPSVSSEMFPTFIQMGRADLFVAGLVVILSGFGILWWLSMRPERRLKELLAQQFFFFFMSVYVRLGMDLSSAWTESVKISCSGRLKKLLLPPEGIRVTTFRDYVNGIIPRASEPMARNLAGLLWMMPTGCGLSDFLQSCAESESERLLFAWEDEVRRLSVVSILPLSLLIFPGSLFLLAGPQVMGAFSL